MSGAGTQRANLRVEQSRVNHGLRFGLCKKASWRNIAPLTMSACVKHFSNALQRALREERHSLSLMVLPFQP
jgi:hypothetical protein